MPTSNHISHNSKTKELNISFRTNPAIFIFDLNKIVYGCESWWGVIEKEDDLKNITNDDIENVWYVKILKILSINAYYNQKCVIVLEYTNCISNDYIYEI